MPSITNEMLPALILFIAVYVFMIALPKWRWLDRKSTRLNSSH